MAGATITYEALFDILRKERNREELQKIQDNFYIDVLTYLAEKHALLEQLGSTEHYAATAEAEKARIQFQNVKKILKELYDRREKKLVMLAVNAVRTGTKTTDKSSFLPEEGPMYDELVLLFRRNRREVLDAVLRRAAPFGGATPVQKPASSAKTTSEKPVVTEPAPKPAESKKPTVEGLAVKFLKSVPRFSGGEDAVFGPFNPQDEATLPERIAKVLVKKGRAEEI